MTENLIKMNFINYLSVFFIISIIGCDNVVSKKVTLTTFEFIVTGDEKGTLTEKEGTARIECKGDKVILFLKEAIDDKTAHSDVLIGELILRLHADDTLGTFELKGISSNSVENVVGIVAFLNRLEFDDFAAQYISNKKRYEIVNKGSITVDEWSTKIRGIIRGSLDVQLSNEDETVNIKGSFSVKLDETNINCTQ